MEATTENLEDFHQRVLKLLATLNKEREANTEEVNQLSSLGREWMKLSAELRDEVDGLLPSLSDFDTAMEGVLKYSKQRTRLSTYRRAILPFKDSFMDAIVLPMMRHEGSPAQAAARRIVALFDGVASLDEEIYILEAARCCAAKCHRAAIVMLWAAVVARLHGAVQIAGFKAFNEAAQIVTKKTGQPYARATKNISFSSPADLQLSRDFDLLVVGIELWKYDIQAFDELHRMLAVRNSAAHPGSYAPTTTDVRQFAEQVRKCAFGLFI